MILVLSDDATKYNTFYSKSKAETILMILILMMYLNHCSVRLYQTYKYLFENVRTGLLIQSLITLVIFQSKTP